MSPLWGSCIVVSLASLASVKQQASDLKFVLKMLSLARAAHPFSKWHCAHRPY